MFKRLHNRLAISPAFYELVLKNLHADIITSSCKILPEANQCSGDKAKTIRNDENNKSNLVSEEYKKKKIGDPLKSKSLLPRDREWNMRKLTTNTHDNSHPLAHVWVQTQDQHEIVVERNSCLKPSHRRDRGAADLQNSLRWPSKYPTMVEVEYNVESISKKTNNVLK